MPFAMPIMLPPAVVAREDLSESWQGDLSWTTSLLYRDSLRQLVGDFRVGDCTYHPIAPLHATFEPPMRGRDGRFLVAGLEHSIIGNGATLRDAKRDWELKVDSAIQGLLATIDFERTTQQRKIWSDLYQFFDLNELRYTNPLKIRAFGQLLGIRGHKYRIQWLDGSRSIVHREHIPVEMVRFRVGQPFEAVVLRDARTWKLIRIESAFAASSLPVVSDQEAQDILAPRPKQNTDSKLAWDS